MYAVNSFFNESVMDDASAGLENFQEFCDEYFILSKQFDVNMMKFQSYTESTERQYDLEVRQAELRCMKENGTMDDFMYLESAAAKGALAKFKNIISKMIKMWAEFIKKIGDIIRVRFSTARVNKVLEVQEAKIQRNPFLGRRKVRFPDSESIINSIRKYKNDLDRHCAKIVTGIVSKGQRYSIANLREDFTNKLNKRVAAKAAMVTMNVLEAIAMVRVQSSALPSCLKKAYDTNGTMLTRLRNSLTSDEAVASVDQALTACANLRTSLEKEELHERMGWVTNMIKAIRTALADIPKASKREQVLPIAASADDEDYDLGDVDAMFEDALEEYAVDDLDLGLDW